MPVSKLVLTHKQALSNKYNPTNLGHIDTALHQLIEADYLQGMETILIYMDEPSDAGHRVVVDPMNQQAVKNAVDDLYRYYDAGSILFIGAQDVVPFQELADVVFTDHDPDTVVPSDLPYACEAGYSDRIEDFADPTRIVGRIAGRLGVEDLDPSAPAELLIQMIENATRFNGLPESYYSNQFCLGSYDWRRSFTSMVDDLFGHTNQVLLIPKRGSTADWTSQQLKRRIHLINCHGTPGTDYWTGDNDDLHYPALYKDQLKGNVLNGSVGVAECCYSAEIHSVDGGGICTQFMEDGIGFFGSTTTSYGLPAGQGHADILTKYFLKNILKGRSLGSALYQARLDFIDEVNDPGIGMVDMKTLAQFFLLGDPTITPILIQPGRITETPVLPPRPFDVIRGVMPFDFPPDAGVTLETVAEERKSPAVPMEEDGNQAIPEEMLEALKKVEKDLKLVNVQRRVWTMPGADGDSLSAKQYISAGARLQEAKVKNINCVIIEGTIRDGRIQLKTSYSK